MTKLYFTTAFKRKKQVVKEQYLVFSISISGEGVWSLKK